MRCNLPFCRYEQEGLRPKNLPGAPRHGLERPQQPDPRARRQLARLVEQDRAGPAASSWPYLLFVLPASFTDVANRGPTPPFTGSVSCRVGGSRPAESAGAARGTTFTFTLPAGGETGADAPGHAAGRQAAAEPGETPRILVVDDDPRMLRFVRDALSQAGYAPLVTGELKTSRGSSAPRGRGWSCST